MLPFLIDTGLDCGHPPELENGRISNLSNSTASYECNDGYYFHNNDTSRTCLSSGNWSDENILCSEYMSFTTLIFYSLAL